MSNSTTMISPICQRCEKKGECSIKRMCACAIINGVEATKSNTITIDIAEPIRMDDSVRKQAEEYFKKQFNESQGLCIRFGNKLDTSK